MALQMHRLDEPGWLQIVLDHLVTELPTDYIVVGQGLAGTVDMLDDPDRYLEWGALVLGPGVAAQIQVAPWGDLVDCDESESGKLTLTTVSPEGEKRVALQTQPQRDEHLVDLSELMDAVASADRLFPQEARDFFSKVQVGNATVMTYATDRWDESVTERLKGIENLHTKASVVDWLRSLRNSTVFQAPEWSEDRVRALVGAILGPMSDDRWDRRWRKLEQQRQSALHVPTRLSEGQLIQEISERYPFPLAFSLRRLDARRYDREKFRCAENVLAFLASFGLVLAEHCGLSLRAGEDLRNLDLITCWSRGISIGHWRDIVRETTLGLIRLRDDGNPVPEFPYFYWERRRGKHPSAIADLIDELPQIRNKFAHGGHPNSTSARAAVMAELRDKTLAILRSVRFLTDYPLWYVERAARQRGEPLIQVTYRSCVGDNPEFEIRQGQCEQLPYEKTMYLRAHEVIVDLTPWVVLRTCPTCGADAVFFLERVDRRKRKLTYKSFNRGHQEEPDEYWGMVSQRLGL